MALPDHFKSCCKKKEIMESHEGFAVGRDGSPVMAKRSFWYSIKALPSPQGEGKDLSRTKVGF